MFVSFDDLEKSVEAKKFLKDQGGLFQAFIKAGDAEVFMQEISPSWNGAIPVTAFYDAQGKLIDLWSGGADFNKFDAFVSSKLNK
jgi:hypothetical protein